MQEDAIITLFSKFLGLLSSICSWPTTGRMDDVSLPLSLSMQVMNRTITR